MKHVGWKSERMFDRYSRNDYLIDGVVSEVLSNLDGDQTEKCFRGLDVSVMDHAF